jgi:serpin B
LLCVLPFVPTFAGCDEDSFGIDDPDDPDVDTQLVRSSLSFDTTTTVADADLKAWGDAQLALASTLLAATPEDNAAVSPLSITMAFSMLSAGARGETLDELAAALGLPAQDALHDLNNVTIRALRERAVAPADGSDGLAINLVNQLYQDEGFTIAPAFLDAIAVHYDLGVRVVPMRAEPEPTREAINAFVSEQTRERIPALLPEGAITPDSVLALVNAVYLKGAWATAFDAATTADAVFHAPSGDVDVPFLNGEILGRYGSIGGADVVELPLAGGQIVLDVIVPRADSTATLDSVWPLLDAAQADGGLVDATLDLGLPKLTVRTPLNLVPALQALGVDDLFVGGTCDLSGINAEESLFVSSAVHETFFAVDEKGVEAAAATAIVVDVESAAPDTVAVNVDEPFSFVLRDRDTGVPLFVGRVADPR